MDSRVVSDGQCTAGQQKRRQRACRVCMGLRPDPRAGERLVKPHTSRYYCNACSIDDIKCWLCNEPSKLWDNPKTCYQVWHEDWNRGVEIPDQYKKKIQMRKIRKKTRRELGDDDASTALQQ